MSSHHTGNNSVPEDLHGGFSVGVVGGLEAKLLQPQPVKEHLQGANQVLQGQPSVTYHPYKEANSIRSFLQSQ